MARHVSATFRQVLGFLRQGFDREAERRRTFEAELAEHIAPHMAVLVRRRAKLLSDGEYRRWSDTLECYMRESLWPLLGDDRDYAERHRTFVTLMVDVSIERAHCRVENVSPVHVVPQFGASLAGSA